MGKQAHTEDPSQSQGSRWYHVSAVGLLLRMGRVTYAMLGPGIRASL